MLFFDTSTGQNSAHKTDWALTEVTEQITSYSIMGKQIYSKADYTTEKINVVFHFIFLLPPPPARSKTHPASGGIVLIDLKNTVFPF